MQLALLVFVQLCKSCIRRDIVALDYFKMFKCILPNAQNDKQHIPYFIVYDQKYKQFLLYLLSGECLRSALEDLYLDSAS